MKTKELTKGALLAALTALFALSFIYLPLFSFMGMFFGVCTVTVMLTYVDSFKVSITALAVSMLLTALFSDIQTMLFSGVLMIVLPGTVIGSCFRGKKPFSVMMIWGGIAYLLAFLGTFLLSKMLYGIDMIEEFKSMAEQSTQMLVSVIESSPEFSDQEAADLFMRTLPTVTNTMILTIPSAFIIVAGLLTLCSVLLSRGVLCRLKKSFSYLPSFSQLHVPKTIAWGYVILMVAEWMAAGNRSFYFLIYNVNLVISFILLVGGISLIKYLINKIGAPKSISLLLLCLILPFAVFLYQIIVLLGMIDAMWDFRKPRIL